MTVIFMAFFSMASSVSQAEEKHGFIFNMINAIGSKLGGKGWDFASNTASNRDRVQSGINAAIDNVDNLDSKNNGDEDKYRSNFAKTAKEGGEAAHDAVGKGYKAAGDALMPEVVDTATKVVDKADDINKKVEKGKSLWDRLFGKDSPPKDVDAVLPDKPVNGGGWAELQDDSPGAGSGGATDTLRQVDNGRNATEVINRQQTTQQPSGGGSVCNGH